MQRRTKIVATLGPASRNREMIRALIQAGVNVFRLNFSHGKHEEHLETLHNIREVAAESKSSIGVLQDLSGPKIRITSIAGDFTTIKDGEPVTLRSGKRSAEQPPLSDQANLYIETLDPAACLKPGQKVLLGDGLIELKTEAITSEGALCRATKGGRLRSRMGIAFPESSIDLPATTDKDLIDFHWGLEHGVDFVALSFVQNASDLKRLRALAREHRAGTQLIAKIERRVALENIDEIIAASDGLMVARGDLGLELPLEQVPFVQTELIRKANAAGRPVIVATQMLQSMVTALRPTRAEATDVAFAVISGTDAVMLSEETAIGENPVACVEYLSRIATEADQAVLKAAPELALVRNNELNVPDAIAFAGCAAAAKVNAAAILACTASGQTARLVAKYRPHQPVYGVSSDPVTRRRLSLVWGVTPLTTETATGLEDEIALDLQALKEQSGLPAGSTVVLTVGGSFQSPGSTNRLEIRKLQ